MLNSATWQWNGRQVLGTIEEERNAKIRSLRTDISLLKDEFFLDLGQRESDRPALTACIEFAQNLTYTRSSLGTAYVSHPLRVARYLLRALPQVGRDYIAIALLHNVPETSAVTLEQLSGHFGPAVADGIGTLLVNRKVPFDSIIEAYYQRLFSAGLELTLIKAFDKLDNLFLLGANPDDAVRARYIDEIRRKLLPFCTTLDAGLGLYLDRLLVETQERGHVPEFKALIQSLKRA